MQLRLLVSVHGLRFFQAQPNEADAVSGTQLAKLVQIRANDMGNLRVAADGLAIDAENNALAVTGNLHCARADRLGHELAPPAWSTASHGGASRSGRTPA